MYTIWTYICSQFNTYQIMSYFAVLVRLCESIYRYVITFSFIRMTFVWINSKVLHIDAQTTSCLVFMKATTSASHLYNKWNVTPYCFITLVMTFHCHFCFHIFDENIVLVNRFESPIVTKSISIYERNLFLLVMILL